MSDDPGSPMLTSEILRYLQNLVAAYPAIASVWLVGSRANGCAKNDSDWDLLVFATPTVLESLRVTNSFQRVDVDLLIVTDGDAFECPWPRSDHPGHFKSGHLFRRLEADGFSSPGWRWQLLSPFCATYVGGKEIGQYITYQAYRVSLE